MIMTCPSNWPEEAPKPEGAARFGWITADPKDIWKQPLLPPPGFKLSSLVSGPPPLEGIEPQVEIPKEAQLDLTSMTSMQMVMVRNELTGKLECCYETWVLRSPFLNLPETQGQPDTN